MGRFHSYLNTTTAILSAYNGEQPFAAFLKSFFAADKKYGSRDRKEIAHLCYCYFRAAMILAEEVMEEKILKALFLCSKTPNDLLLELKPEWCTGISLPPWEKLKIISSDSDIKDLFPFEEEVSSGINAGDYAASMLVQPGLFIRIRPGHQQAVLNKLEKSGIAYTIEGEMGVALPNTTKADTVFETDKEVVIQDISSQRVAEFLEPVRREQPGRLKVWDCCAASGGKSILAFDTLGDMELSVSDVRRSILQNLEKRFSAAGIKHHKSFAADLTHPAEKDILPGNQQSLIICDAPCTGSGTWGRTPEQLYFFRKEKIEMYAGRQKKIISAVLPRLQHGGYFLYITCSVFKKENEEMASFIKEEFHLQPVKMELLKGYDKKADTMFAALFRKGL